MTPYKTERIEKAIQNKLEQCRSALLNTNAALNPEFKASDCIREGQRALLQRIDTVIDLLTERLSPICNSPTPLEERCDVQRQLPSYFMEQDCFLDKISKATDRLELLLENLEL